MTKVSIIIPTYNRAPLLGITLNSFIDLNYPKDHYEIIVADNNSTDNTKNIVDAFIQKGYANIRYFFEPRQGVHYARNSAAKIAQYELLYFTDDDMIADINLMKELVKVFDFNKNVGVATGKVLPCWEKEPPQWIKKHCNNYLLSILDPPYEFVISKELNYLYSCHQAILKKVFFETEGFNPEYTKGHYLGDGESGLNFKIKKLGYLFGYNGSSLIKHIIPQTRTTQRYLNRRLLNNGIAHSYSEIRQFYSKKPKLIGLILFRCLILIPQKILYLILKTIIKKDWNNLRFVLAYIYYYSGRVGFETRFLFNNNFRRFVLKKDWLTNDSEFDSVSI